jgi:hypothetical protein
MAKEKKKGFNVPKLTDEQVKQLQSDNEELREMSMLALLDASLPALPKEHVFKMRDRRTVELVHHAAFELVGGVPMMAQWAKENPTEFYKLYSRLLPQEKTVQANTQINIVSEIGKNALDTINVTTEVVEGGLNEPEPDDADEY